MCMFRFQEIFKQNGFNRLKKKTFGLIYMKTSEISIWITKFYNHTLSKLKEKWGWNIFIDIWIPLSSSYTEGWDYLFEFDSF